MLEHKANIVQMMLKVAVVRRVHTFPLCYIKAKKTIARCLRDNRGGEPEEAANCCNHIIIIAVSFDA